MLEVCLTSQDMGVCEVKMLWDIFKTWLKWRKDWDSLCNRCGKCCYSRSAWAKGKVAIHYDSPCEYLDIETFSAPLRLALNDRPPDDQRPRQGSAAERAGQSENAARWSGSETHLCKVYENRFRKCNHCGKVNLFVALFHPTLPLEVAPCKNALRALARPTFSIS